MVKVYISYDPNDKHFVNLLITLLEFHYINCLPQNNKLASKSEIEDSNAIIIVQSNESLNSDIIKKEIDLYNINNVKKLQRIVILLDSINSDDVNLGLNDFHTINFNQCYLTGFKKLTSLFNIEFLPHHDRRYSDERRANSEQRDGKDRRVSSMTQRLRTGFWKSYSMATGAGVYDYLMMEAVQQVLVSEFLKQEVKLYKYYDSIGNECDPVKVLEDSTNDIWDRYSKGSFERAIFVIEAIAERILETHKVVTIDRRKLNDRRICDDRRHQQLNYQYQNV